MAALLSFWQEILPVYQNNVFTLMSNISVPSQESELSSFMVKQQCEWFTSEYEADQ